jgi:flagellar biosynthesis protein FliP
VSVVQPIRLPVVGPIVGHIREVRSFRQRAHNEHPRLAKTYQLGLAAMSLLFVILFAMAHRANAQNDPSTIDTPAVSVAPSTPSIATAVRSQPTSGANGIPTAVPSGSSATPNSPDAPVRPVTPSSNTDLSVDLTGLKDNPNQSVIIIVGLTLLSLAPSLLVMLTSFTRMSIVLSLTRNALGLQSIPPNQVVVGLALFLSLFVMGPTFTKMNDVGLQPLLNGQKSQTEAISDGMEPLKDFMLSNTRKAELKMMIGASRQERPATPKDVTMTTLIPAFILSELKTAFIIGFAIFIPFLVIDLVVSSILMALGMMMLPPSFVALPFKLLLFVMVDGWSMVAQSLLRSFR